MWPQYTYIALICINFGICMARYGKPKTDSYDFIDLVIGPAFGVTLMYYGGFFVPLGWHP